MSIKYISYEDRHNQTNQQQQKTTRQILTFTMITISVSLLHFQEEEEEKKPFQCKQKSIEKIVNVFTFHSNPNIQYGKK